VGVSGDFQPIHHDEAFAKSIGLPSIFANGMMHGGMLTRVLTDWAGVESVQRFKIRFGAVVWPGDTLAFTGRVEGKRIEGENHLVDVSLTVTNQNGEQAISGQATLRLPVRA
jgi:acyl dehydratase